MKRFILAEFIERSNEIHKGGDMIIPRLFMKTTARRQRLCARSTGRSFGRPLSIFPGTGARMIVMAQV